MKRFLILFAGTAFILSIHSEASAWFGGKKKTDEAVVAEQPAAEKKEKPAKAAPVTKEDKDKQEKALAKKQLEEKKRKELANSEWTIELTPLGGKGKKEEETVVFKDNQVSFVSYGKKGFPATNYTLTVQDDGMVVWETMQTSEKSGIAFWRGEMPDMQNMRGIFSYHPDEKTSVDYSFVSTGKRGI
jgi:hypothetical protein